MWITRGIKTNIYYTRSVYRYLNIELELRHLYEALKNTMLCISYFKQATLRSRAVKAIKNLIKLDPENLLDSLV